MPTPEPIPRAMSDVPPLSRARRAASPAWERLLRRAERQVEQGRYTQAIAILERAIAEGADPYDYRLRIADLYRIMQEWTPALAAAEEAVALAPTRLFAYEVMMAIALEAGDCHRAIAASYAVIKIAPRHLLAHNALGAAYIQMGQVDSAMRVTNTLIRLDPQTAAHHFKKGLLCQHKGEVALAVHEFTDTILLEPDGPHADAAREALETLDMFQLNQIVTLGIEDRVFRAKLMRNPVDAALERGFALSEMGNHILQEITSQPLPDFPEPCLPLLYN